MIKKGIALSIIGFFSSVFANNYTSWYQPELNTSWHWQLKGEVRLDKNADVYIIDLFDTDTKTIEFLHSQGKKVIAYFSAGSYEKWRDDASLFESNTLGKKMDGWDERWLDIRSNNIKAVMQNRIEFARRKGFDGVEADNVDGYQNDTGFTLSFKDQIDFNIFLSQEAHKRGLAIALKNDLDQIKILEPYFDFAINEECHKYNECEKTLPFIRANKPVFNAEYDPKYQNIICKKSLQLGLSTQILPLELDDSFCLQCR